jgi:hypothetical protein
MKGIACTYDHITPAMIQQIDDALEARFQRSLLTLTRAEQDQLVGWFPHLGPVLERPRQALPRDR